MKLIFAAALILTPCRSLSNESSVQSRRVRGSGGQRRTAIPNCPGEESFSYIMTGDSRCNVDDFVAKLEEKKSSDCNASGMKILRNLLDVPDNNEVRSRVAELCADAYANIDASSLFADISKKGFEFDNEYFSGGTSWNYEIQTNAGENVLKDSAARVGRVFREEAQNGVIELPTYLPSFDPDQDGCEMNAAFCCWSQDRQAKDNNGNCNTPYDSRCIDQDPGDNANFCYTDHSRSSTATHVAGGFSIFGNVQNGQENIEGPIHCHGFAWGDDPSHSSSVYKGNNLFFVSMYDHMYTRGYVRNAPGSSMCACAENMAVVTRADCTEIDADEDVEISFDAETETFSVAVEIDDIDFNACQGTDANGNDDNNDLESYYRRLVERGLASQDNLEKLQETLVGDEAGKCNEAIINFMSQQGFERTSGANSLGTASMTEKEVAMIDPTYANGAASGGGKGMDMPDAPEEFIEGGEEVNGASKEPVEATTVSGDLDDEQKEISGETVDEEEKEVSGVTIDEVVVDGRTVDSVEPEPAPVRNLGKKCKALCYDPESTETWEEKCTWNTCKKCDEC